MPTIIRELHCDFQIDMRIADFNYELPEHLIAKEPVNPRDYSRLLVVERNSNRISHQHFFDLPKFLEAGDCLVRNTSRVIPARLPAVSQARQKVEVFLLKRLSSSPHTWQCLVKPGKKIKETLAVHLKDETLVTIKKNPDGSFEVILPEKADFWSWLDLVGEPPLPPYIKRNVTPQDTERYQTVFSNVMGSVAAPTAGLHFTDRLLEELRNKKVEIADVLLHVGYGTFAPMRGEYLKDHVMHEEFYSIPKPTLDLIQKTHQQNRRVVAVGTTSLRSLESLSIFGPEGHTNLFITPGYEFKEINGLITNFHLPLSTLFVLVSTLLGPELCKKVYQEAIDQEYRFYSYGDAMLVL
ncbi:MAG: tRNA preQ1(34) S-adenosylmethionine ribosyltransferase-isomerase QueA [Pseudomonadota bacterium]